MTEKIQTLLAGRWRDASGPAYATEYPHDGSVVAELHAATVGDVDEAVQTAEQARLQPAWAVGPGPGGRPGRRWDLA